MLQELFTRHIKHITKEVKEALAEDHYDAVVIHAGSQAYYHADDREIPFRPHPHFARFTPTEGPGHVILVTKEDDRPLLIELRPDDYWYEHTDASDPLWRDALPSLTATDDDTLWKEVATRTGTHKIAFIGLSGDQRGIAAVNPEGLLAALDQSRAVKTEYEVFCIAEANEIAARGFRKAEALFRAGASELEIHHAYLVATGSTEAGLPYATIVALNEKSAILHYQRKRAAVNRGITFLLDAGVAVRGYASDITRTYASPAAPQAFKDLLAGLGALQQKLAERAVPGAQFIELHDEAHCGIAEILKRSGVIAGSVDEAYEKRVTHAFFPHGLGHMLGLQVHDVGNRSTEGLDHPLAKIYPNIRTNRRLEAGNVTTIEPGIYFIPSLLDELRAEHAQRIDWDLVATLIPCGGIRIEDDVAVAATGPQNLTRVHLP